MKTLLSKLFKKQWFLGFVFGCGGVFWFCVFSGFCTFGLVEKIFDENGFLCWTMLLCVEMSQWFFSKDKFFSLSKFVLESFLNFFLQFCLVAPWKFLLDEWTCKIFMCNSSKERFEYMSRHVLLVLQVAA